MKHGFISLIALLVQVMAAAQESRQIKARNIERASSRTEQWQKEKREVSFETTHYDRKGREVLVEYFNTDSICYKTERFEYNGKGRTVLHVTADSSQKRTIAVEQHYDQWNRLAEKLTTENGETTERVVYTYNTFDDKTSEILYGKDGKLKKKTMFMYDKRGMLIRRTVENGEGTIINDKTIQYTY